MVRKSTGCLVGIAGIFALMAGLVVNISAAPRPLLRLLSPKAGS